MPVTPDLTHPLLPLTASVQDSELARASEPLDAIDAALIATIWNAETCPAPLLPLLAWSLSVDSWEDAWTDAMKRRAIADAPAYHRIKGTRESIDMIARWFGCRASVIEWWQQSPQGRRGTALVRAYVTEWLDETSEPLTPQLLKKIRAALLVTKPKSRAIAIEIGVGAQVKPALAGALTGIAAPQFNVTASPETDLAVNPALAGALSGLAVISCSMRVN